MCLATCCRIHPKFATDEIGEGFKVFKWMYVRQSQKGVALAKSRRALCFEYRIHDHSSQVVRHKWLSSDIHSKIHIYSSSGRRYEAAFHIFKTRAGAEKWIGGNNGQYKIVPVFYRKVVARGSQYTVQGPAKVIVAREMYVQ